jgi:hypothetical protein
MPAKKGKQPDEKFSLMVTVKQRDSPIHATGLAIKETTKEIRKLK